MQMAWSTNDMSQRFGIQVGELAFKASCLRAQFRITRSQKDAKLLLRRPP